MQTISTYASRTGATRTHSSHIHSAKALRRLSYKPVLSLALGLVLIAAAATPIAAKPAKPMPEAVMARIEAARCILPVSTNMRLSPHLGLRHRAAVGVTEVSDAFVVVVSEETGYISIANNGELRSNISIDRLESHINDALAPRLTAPEPETVPAATA